MRAASGQWSLSSKVLAAEVCLFEEVRTNKTIETNQTTYADEQMTDKHFRRTS